MKKLERSLAEGLAALELDATTEQQEQLLKFLFLLQKWNRVYNLTAVSDPEQAIRLHLLDSLAISPYLAGSRILDVGTGAGLPGIPLAIFHSVSAFVLLDSNAKKTRFVQQAVLELGLQQVEIATARIEQYQPADGFDTVLTRAWASLATIWDATGRLLKPDGRILALKGQFPEEEMADLKAGQVRVHKLHVPGLGAERHLVEIMSDREING